MAQILKSHGQGNTVKEIRSRKYGQGNTVKENGQENQVSPPAAIQVDSLPKNVGLAAFSGDQSPK
jgi:hypothetical protein